jgi:hypothetical protein
MNREDRREDGALVKLAKKLSGLKIRFFRGAFWKSFTGRFGNDRGYFVPMLPIIDFLRGEDK